MPIFHCRISVSQLQLNINRHTHIYEFLVNKSRMKPDLLGQFYEIIVTFFDNHLLFVLLEDLYEDSNSDEFCVIHPSRKLEVLPTTASVDSPM